MSLVDLLPFKNYGIVFLLLLSYIGIWHVSAKYAEDGWEKEKVVLVQKALETTQQREALADIIGKRLETAIGNIHITQQTIHQEVIHEVTKEPVYTNCVTTPDGVRLIESAIDNQGQSTSK